MVYEVRGEEDDESISVKLSVAYETESEALEPEDLDAHFARTLYGRRLDGEGGERYAAAKRIYRRAVTKILDLFKQQKLVAYYLLDMSLNKFCVFFERSNSRGIHLNFTDILAAKLYSGFNLRRKIDEFEGSSDYKLNREILVRTIAYISFSERKTTISIDKSHILKHLEADDFKQHWDVTCRLYTDAMDYLTSQRYIVSQQWMPSANMIIPLMLFLRSIKSFSQMSEDQRKFLQFWYWTSIFANRYSGSSNEVIIMDSHVLVQIANGERTSQRGYFQGLRSRVTDPSDLFSYVKQTSTIYRGVLNLLHFAAEGLPDWKSNHKLSRTMKLESHHIYPRAYIASSGELDIPNTEASELAECVVNRTLIPKLTNIKIGKKSPSTYLSELRRGNPELSRCLEQHAISPHIVESPAWDKDFKRFLDERAAKIVELIQRYTVAPALEMARLHGAPQTEVARESVASMRLSDMVEAGLVAIGDAIYITNHEQERATIVDGSTVDFRGEKMPINRWGQQITGWKALNIYEWTVHEPTGRKLDELRKGS